LSIPEGHQKPCPISNKLLPNDRDSRRSTSIDNKALPIWRGRSQPLEIDDIRARYRDDIPWLSNPPGRIEPPENNNRLLPLDRDSRRSTSIDNKALPIWRGRSQPLEIDAAARCTETLIDEAHR
jgi:hypothetical protein